MNTDSLSLQLKEHALSHGVDLVGITSARPFTKRDGVGTVIDPKELLADSRSIVVTGFYSHEVVDAPLADKDNPRGRFPHAESLRALTPMTDHCVEIIKGFLERQGYEAVANKNNRIPDKMAAVRAGVGKYGKNAVVLTRDYGAYVRLVTVLTNAPLVYEEHDLDASDCGECDLCLKACPTGAIHEPYRVTRALCITDWLWGTFVPIHMREKQGNRIFGCGECLDVCPRNRELTPRTEYPVRSEDVGAAPELVPLVTEGEEYYRRTLPSFPMRAGVDVLRGNAIIALGNAGTDRAIGPLCTTLTHPRPQIRAYSAWALGRIGGARAEEALQKALDGEKDREVRKEMQQALGICV